MDGKIETSELGVIESKFASFVKVLNHIENLKIVRFSLISDPNSRKVIFQRILIFGVVQNATFWVKLLFTIVVYPAVLFKVSVCLIRIIVFHPVGLRLKNRLYSITKRGIDWSRCVTLKRVCTISAKDNEAQNDETEHTGDACANADLFLLRHAIIFEQG